MPGNMFESSWYVQYEQAIFQTDCGVTICCFIAEKASNQFHVHWNYISNSYFMGMQIHRLRFCLVCI